jgi:hypothetical protein
MSVFFEAEIACLQSKTMGRLATPANTRERHSVATHSATFRDRKETPKIN